jgi:ribosomal protein RSM22 (predicted rRNA methylase)
MSGLPGFIGGTLQGRLEHLSRADLRASAQRMSDSYRQGGTSDVIRSDLDALAYAIVRMPATYAAVRAALAQTADIIPDYAPRSLLDVGSGPGTASWAALDTWPSLERAALIDSNPYLLALAAAFRESPAAPSVALSTTRDSLAAALTEAASADMVMASYVLAELAGGVRAGVLDRLWTLSGRLLVVVEPGTPDGFRRILECRDFLLGRGAQIVAPCSHEGRCPLATGERWCHFGARLPRSRDHLLTKDASVPFEDEKFCYLVAGKGFAGLARGRRILATPKVGKTGVALTLCTPDVAEERVVARRLKDDYRAAKRLGWGDAIRS